jgi:hypothetical protein
MEYAAAMQWIHFEMPKWFSLGVIAVVFLVAYVIARRKGPVPDSEDGAAAALLEDKN